MTRPMRRFLSVFFFLLVAAGALRGAQAATISVANTVDSFDDGQCSLRDAIQSVNQGFDFGGCDFDETEIFGTNDTINLTATQAYVLDIDGGGENQNNNGDLDITASVQIIGLGSGQTTVTAEFATGERDRIFDINDGGDDDGEGGFDPEITVLLQGMTVTNGNTEDVSEDGGGIRIIGVAAAVTLNDVIVTDNTSGSDGGGIYNQSGFLTITNSRINANHAEESNEGGGITNESQLLITGSTLDGNTASDGGAIENESDAELVIVNSTLSRNTAQSEGNQDAGGGDFGRGGALTNSGLFAFINTTVSGNTAGSLGGGIFSDLPNSGDGVDPSGSFALLFNVTIADNTVVDVDGIGGGICFDCEPQAMGDTGESFFVTNTLIAQNTAPSGADCAGTFLSDGFNLIGDPALCDGFTNTGDQTNVADAGIGALAKNGGSTETHALLDGSPAIDRANNDEGCQAPNPDALINTGDLTLEALTTDQRPFTRPIAVLDPAAPICDIGAFEFQTFDFDVTKVDGLNGQPANVGDNFTYTITVTNSGPGDAVSVVATDPLPATLTFVSASASQGTCSQAAGTVTCDLGALAEGATATISITVTATSAGTLTNVVTVVSQGEDQTTVTKTAQATTVVQGGTNLLLFGNGCAMTGAGGSPAGMVFMAFALLTGWLQARFRE